MATVRPGELSIELVKLNSVGAKLLSQEQEVAIIIKNGNDVIGFLKEKPSQRFPAYPKRLKSKKNYETTTSIC